MLFYKFLIITLILGYSSSCSDNEFESDCVNPCNTCEQRGRCDPPSTCQHGCDCKHGFFRDENGQCVQEHHCPAKTGHPRCPRNTLYHPCAPLALATCENPYPEPDYEDECVPGCVCRPGLLRRRDGQCVTPNQCDSREDHRKAIPDVCKEDEEFYECTPSCKNTCENINNPGVKCRCGPPGCFCREGLVKRTDGKCVHPKHCPRLPSPNDPPPKCPKNAIFIRCGSPCPPTCDDLQPEPCEEKCTTACYCKPGYLKRKDGVCVRPIDCHPQKKQKRPAPKCPENAIFIECGSPCPPTCEDRLPVCKDKCTRACYCKPGYLLKTDEAKCVKPEHCNMNHTSADAMHCPENEEVSDCVIPCNDCKIKGDCKFFACNKGCDCKKGYFRNKDGKCILASECPYITEPQLKCATDEQFYECTPSCKNTCENIYNPEVRCQCGPPGCFCKEGLVKREDGKCVPPDQCEVSPQPECRADEQFYECTPICRNTCKNFANLAAKCFCGPPGCFCKEGLVKREDGKCVPRDQCNVPPQPECRADEQFYECTPICRNTCKNFANLGAKCYCGPPGCFCKEGLVKREDGKCVPRDQCNKPQHECGPDEQFYECKPSCKNTCSHFFNPGVQCRCAPRGCFCKKGLVKRSDGKCVPPSECPVSPKPDCGEDQQFYNCTPSCKNTCKNFFNPGIRCGCGPPGCFCKEGLVKRADGKCIPPDQCQPIKPSPCPENAEFSPCGPSCRPTCKDPYPAPCSGSCAKGCFCKSGFVEDTDGRCVRLKDCSKKCPLPGEEFQECGSMCPDTCENRGHHPPGSCPYRCNRGCFCKKGLYRTKNGQCVPLKDCDREHYLPTTPKPSIQRENKDVTVPDDCHGCPNRAECEAYCKSLGDFIGICVGKDSLHCRCA